MKNVLNTIIYINAYGRQSEYRHYARRKVTVRGAARILKRECIEGTVERVEAILDLR